jgi:hypothetical protein
MPSFAKDLLTERGAACAHGVFAPETLGACSDDLDAMIERWRAGECADADYWACPLDSGGEESLFRIHRLERKTHWPRVLVHEPRFEALLADVFGGPAIATECALTIKMSGAGIRVPWHRDPVDSALGEVFNFSIYLDASTPGNGCLYVLPGSHRSGAEPAKAMPAEAEPVPARAGDVVVHDVHVHHGSPESSAPSRRRAIVIEFTRGDRASLSRGRPIFEA